MFISKILWHSCVCTIYLISLPALSATDTSISLELGSDSNSGHNSYLSARHQFKNRLQVNASSSKSQLTDSNGSSIDSSAYSLGIKTNPSALFSAGLSSSHAQQAKNLNINSTALTLDINSLNWSLYLVPEWRQVSITSNINPRNYDFDSNGYTAGVGYYGWDPVYISASRTRYDYPSRINTFSSRPNLYSYVFGSNTVNQVFALEDQRTTLEAGYFFSQVSLSLSHSSGRSAVDQSISVVDKLYLAYQLSSQWTLKSTLGRSRIDNSDSNTRFASLGISYQW